MKEFEELGGIITIITTIIAWIDNMMIKQLSLIDMLDLIGIKWALALLNYSISKSIDQYYMKIDYLVREQMAKKLFSFLFYCIIYI